MNMNEAPEGVNTVNTEGDDIAAAIKGAAAELGIEASAVGWELDKSWFRTDDGRVVARDTVKINAWERSPEEVAAAAAKAAARPAREERPRRDRDDRGRGRGRDDRGRGRDRDDRGRGRGRDDRGRGRRDDRPRREMIAADTPEATGEVADDTRAWVTDLLGHMDIEAEVKIYGDDSNITIQLKSESGGKLVGKRGRTLQAIQHLLAGSVGADHEDTTFRIDVADDRDRDGDRDRGGRGRDRDRDRDGGGRRDKRDDERNARKLKDLTSKIAVRVNETGEAEVIRKELNSYDRRLVHVAAKELGVGSRSIGEGNHKQIEIYRLEESADDDTTENGVDEPVEAVTADAVETSEAEGAQA
ncbi:MAG: KH domain-containing protein [Proteobacteria bacterium]|nr:KH domain-containing protein [Pseudomonadota bacterium]